MNHMLNLLFTPNTSLALGHFRSNFCVGSFQVVDLLQLCEISTMRRFFERKLRGRHVARDVSESDNEASGVTASQKQNLSVAKTFPAGIKVLYASESSIVE